MLFIHLSKGIMRSHILGSYIYLGGGGRGSSGTVDKDFHYRESQLENWKFSLTWTTIENENNIKF